MTDYYISEVRGSGAMVEDVRVHVVPPPAKHKGAWWPRGYVVGAIQRGRLFSVLKPCPAGVESAGPLRLVRVGGGQFLRVEGPLAMRDDFGPHVPVLPGPRLRHA